MRINTKATFSYVFVSLSYIIVVLPVLVYLKPDYNKNDRKLSLEFFA
jgi:hypothetical protein